MTSKSAYRDHEEMLSNGAGTENLASNAIELNEKYDEDKNTQHLRLETDVNSPLDSIEQNHLSNDIMEVQNYTHPKENSFIEPLTTISSGNEHQEIFSSAEDTTSNLIEHEKNGEEAEHPYLRPETDIDKPFKNLAANATQLEDSRFDRDLSFSCLKCDKNFSNQRNLAAHDFMKHQSSIDSNARVHTEEKPFSCSNCDYKCSYPSAMKTHERIHTGDKPFSCSKCDKAFKQESNLRRHERIHTGEKPFNCSKCDKTFRQSSDFLGHG